MKYSSLKSQNEKVLHVSAPTGGADRSASPLYIDDNCLADCKNVIFRDGSLKTRQGLFAKETDIIKGDFTEEAFYNRYSLTESEIFINGHGFRIAVEYTEYDMAEYYASVYFIGTDCSVTKAGYMQFNRISDEIFYIPLNITFYQGKPQNGGGIFALVSLCNIENYTQKLYTIYEINSNLDGWNEVTDYYIPTVYINGRGNSYETASASNQAFTGNPTVLEQPNLLNGIFYAYFSSDGYSSEFSLPFSNISDENVICRVHYSPSSYTEWVIYAGKNSASQTFMGTTVTVNVDRSKGLIYFTVEAGDYSVPLMGKYKANNIRITATKKTERSFDDVVSATCCQIFKSRIILSGGIKDNRIYSARYDSPLYFPYSGVTEIGEARLPVTALTVSGEKILAFKATELYEIDMKKGKAINTASLLADNDSVFYSTDSFTVTAISQSTGCSGKKALTYYKGRTVWIGSDGNIYALTASGEIKIMSDKVRYDLKEISDYNGVALNNGQYCMFIFSKRVFTAEFDTTLNGKNAIWNIWEFPAELRILGGIDHEISPVFLCQYNSVTCYTATLSGESDILLNRTADTTAQSRNIVSSITTRSFAPEGVNMRKRLNRIYMQLDAKGSIEITVNGKSLNLDGSTLKNGGEGLRKVTVLPEISSFYSLNIALKSDTYIALSEIDIHYIKMQ